MPNSRLLARPALLFLFAAIFADAQALTLESGYLRLEVDASSGRIIGLSKKDAAFNLVAPSMDTPLWKVHMRQPEDGPLLPEHAGAFTVEPVEPDPAALRMVWTDFGRDAAPGLRVIADVTLDAAAASSYWSITIQGLGDLCPETVCFPRLGGLAKQEGEVLAVPVWMGNMTKGPRRLLNAGDTARRLEWTYPGILSMQCLSLYGEEGSGLYAACDDTAAYGKRFALFGDGTGGIGFEMVQLPEDAQNPGGAYRAPYRVIIGLLEGDWFSAAERYRTWALEQSWARNSRLRAGGTPQWAVDTGIWVWNRGRSENVLPPAASLQQAGEVPVSVFWHWWHGCAYDVGFPEYFPPREGTESFQGAVRQAHDKGLNAIVYMNQRLWGMTTESWEERDAARFAVKGPDGTIRPEVYNTFTKSPCASMCMGTEFWRDTYAGLATRAVLDLGVSGIYMDQACSSLSCYDPNHGHAAGGGVYWIEGFQSLQQDIRRRCAAGGREVALAGEGCGEAWLPYLDLMLSLQVSMERYAAPGDWCPIPFFHAVYHGYCLPFGNYASLTMPPYDELWPKETAPDQPLALLDRKFSTQFRLEQGRAFAWGQVPTVANFRPEHLESRAAEIGFVLRLARLRQRATEYLLHGTMLRPPRMDIPNSNIPISRLSIYAGQQGGLVEYEARHPLLITSAWQSPGGGIAVVAVNISEAPQHVAFSLDAQDVPLPADGILRVLECSGGERRVSRHDGKFTVEEELPPAAARIYVVEDARKRGASPD